MLMLTISIVKDTNIISIDTFASTTSADGKRFLVTGTYTGTARITSVNVKGLHIPDREVYYAIGRQYEVGSEYDITLNIFEKDGKYYTDYFPEEIELTFDETYNRVVMTNHMEETGDLNSIGFVHFEGGFRSISVSETEDIRYVYTVGMEGAYYTDTINGYTGLHAVSLDLDLERDISFELDESVTDEPIDVPDEEDVIDEELESIVVEEEEEETIKVRGRLLNYDLGDEDELSKELNVSAMKDKQMEKILSFFKEPSPNKLIVMNVVDFYGNELGSYGPVMTDDEGRFEFEYTKPMVDEYDLFVMMPLGNFPSGEAAGPSIGVKDWVYSGGTQHNVILELAAEEVRSSWEEEEIDLEDVFISGGDSRRFISNESTDTDFVNGFIYANSYLFALLAERFYTEMVAYELPADKMSPLIIYHNANKVMPNGIGGNYDHLANYVNLNDNLSTWYGMQDINVAIYHEFSHKVMYDLYGGRYPKSVKEDWLIGTYGNQSTANSLTEGFAYFMQNAISEYYGGAGLIELSPVYGHIEPNYPAWFEGGLHEARAVSGVLYDLYDQGRDGGGIGFNADDDTISIDLKELVNLILEAPLDSVGQLYDKLVKVYPSQKKGIDSIFIEHGFFSVAEPVTDELGIYHKGEAFVDSNKNFKYDQGEKVINFNGTEEDGFRFQEYKEGAKIGYAAYSGNEARQMQVADPKFRIKTNSSYPVYAYDIIFLDAPFMNYSGTALNRDGYVQMPLLPYNHEMIVSVYPVNQWSEETVFTISSSDIKSNYSAIMEQGYLGEWDLDDNNMTLDYIPPLIAILSGDSSNLGDEELGSSPVFEQLSTYEFGEPFIEKPYVRPPEAVIEHMEETEEVETEEIETTADVTSSDEALSDDHDEPVQENNSDFNQDSTSIMDDDSGNQLNEWLRDLIPGSRGSIIIIFAAIGAVGVLIIVGIIYGIVKLVK